jgi:hypothetical protein
VVRVTGEQERERERERDVDEIRKLNVERRL